ncbi:MAG: alkaline phosphatase family protein [Clostridia bacterium]|nr:alkaline phosphatase family protein [Clostridia bacterium]
MNKVVLVLADGMRPDGLENFPVARRMMAEGAYAPDAQTVYPSVTLPCHMSLFHSVTPQRHGITTNIYMPQVRPIPGLCEALRRAGKTCAFFYNWEELRDLSRPDSLAFAGYFSGHVHGYEAANRMVTDAAVSCIREHAPDFLFVYYGWSDSAGHNHGWLSEEYFHAVNDAWEQIARLREILPEEYTLMVTADHGGHERSHGCDIPEDMTIPLFACGKPFAAGSGFENANIMDIAPTVATLLGAPIPEEWEGSSLL